MKNFNCPSQTRLIFRKCAQIYIVILVVEFVDVEKKIPVHIAKALTSNK